MAATPGNVNAQQGPDQESDTDLGPRFTAPPLLRPRIRSVTPPLTELGNISPSRPRGRINIPSSHSQLQSPLFSTLPGEIRMQIWRELMADQVINFFLEPRPPYTLRFCGCRVSPEVDMRLPESRGGWVGLLQTCRRVYTETIDLIYTQNVFYAHNEYTLMYLARKIPEPRFKTIRNIHLKTFCPSPRHTQVSAYGPLNPGMEVWKTFAGMQGLERLTVEIGGREWMGPETKWWDGTDVRAWRNSEAFYLQRMDIIKQVKEFKVIVSWPQGMHDIDAVIPLCTVERRWPPAAYWDFPRVVA